MRGQIYYWIRMFKKEKIFVLLSVLQLSFSIFYLGFAGAQRVYGKGIADAGVYFRSGREDIYFFSKTDDNVYQGEVLKKILVKWFDEEKKGFSFLTSTKTEDGKKMLLCIGENAKKVFDSLEVERGMGYGRVKDKNLFNVDSIEIKAGGRDYSYELVFTNKIQDRVLITKGIVDLADTIIVCISCQDFYDIFHGYYYGEFFNNIHFEDGDQNELSIFLKEMKEAGYNVSPQNRSMYIDMYFGEIFRSGLLYEVFFLVVTIFVIYNLYIHMIFIMKRNARLHAVQYLCGERDIFIWLRLYTFMISIALMSVVIATVMLAVLDFPEWKIVHTEILIMISVLYAAVGWKTKKMFSASHYEKYLKAER